MEAGFLVANKRREEVSRSLGAGNLKSFFQITLPQLKTFVFAAFIIGVVKTSTELSASLILAPADWRSLSLGIVHYIDQGALPLAFSFERAAGVRYRKRDYSGSLLVPCTDPWGYCQAIPGGS